ncbi:MAG: Heme/hemopexin transporter protein HuxB [Candidatus Anoxychlamydiales bacterium]|nr:Heme/hemopexin transporter protein HuxB [Candidatus Anoxychlamydiales bacterium]
MKKIFFIVFISLFLNIQNVIALQNQKVSNKEDPFFLKNFKCQKNELAPKLKGIILNSEDIDKKCTGICIDNLKIPGNLNEFKRNLIKYLNKPIDEQLVKDIKEEISYFYQKQNHPFIKIGIPEQNVSDGVIHLEIIETKLGEIKLNYGKWTNKQTIESWIRLKKNCPIELNNLTMDLFWLNKNPFRNVQTVLFPGTEKRTTDIEFLIKDRFPLRVYSGIDNTGTNVTGNNRIFAGLLANTYKDQLLSYQYTSGSNMREFQSHTFKYTIPLPWRNQLELIAGYSYFDVNYEVAGTTGKFHSDGMSLQTSARYDIPLLVKQKLSILSFGVDFKRTNNNATFSDIPVFGAYSNLTQMMASYNIGSSSKYLDWDFEIEGYCSPGRWISDQSNARYATIRAFAKNQYIYLRSSSSLLFFIKDFRAAMFFRWQVANQNLLPSETFGLGGYNTVRGYRERVYNGDLALLYNLEFQSPNIKSKIGAFRLLGFFDVGKVWKYKKAGSEKKSQLLYSVGPGLRYFWSPYITSRLDWGIKLRRRPDLGSSKHKLHFSLIVGY